MTDGSSLLELAADAEVDLDQLRFLAEEAADINVSQPETGNTALHLAAAAGNLDACKLLVELGADPLKRNKVNRTPGKQIRLQPDMKDYFLDVEAAAVQARSAKQHGLWDDKIKATLTESALRIGCL